MKSLSVLAVFAFLSCSLFAQTFTSTEELPLSRIDTEVGAVERTDLDEAALWGLSTEEWHRHLELRQGIRGSLSTEGISPIEVLGIHARTDSERRHYARIWAQMMIEDADRVLKFQKAYDQAVGEITNGRLLIDPNLLPEPDDKDTKKLLSTDRIMFFASLDCLACEVVFERTSALLTEVSGIDIYFVNADSSDHARIRDWARKRGVAPTDVKNRKISLNLDDGVLKHLAPRIRKVPFLMLVRDDVPQKFPGDLLP